MQALFLLNPSSGYSRTKSDYVSNPSPHSPGVIGVGPRLVQELTTIQLRGIEFIETSIRNSLTLCLIR
jgi:hypothetical protein